MKFSLRSQPSGPVLSSRAASFGVWGSAARPNAGGTLSLYEDRLVFEASAGGARTEIPLAEIDRIAVGSQRGRDGRLTPVLKITWRGNLMFGVAVDRPDRWMNAVESLTRGRGRTIALDRTIPLRTANPNFRWVIGVLLLLVITVSVALPLFFTWMQARVNTRALQRAPVEAPAGPDAEASDAAADQAVGS